MTWDKIWNVFATMWKLVFFFDISGGICVYILAQVTVHMSIISLLFVTIPTTFVRKPNFHKCTLRLTSMSLLYVTNIGILFIKSQKLLQAFLSKVRRALNFFSCETYFAQKCLKKFLWFNENDCNVHHIEQTYWNQSWCTFFEIWFPNESGWHCCKLETYYGHMDQRNGIIRYWNHWCFSLDHKHDKGENSYQDPQQT